MASPRVLSIGIKAVDLCKMCGPSIPFLFMLASWFSTEPAGAPKQGLVDLLMEYLEVRYPDVELEGDILYVSVSRQTLFHVKSNRLMQEYPVATASNGTGSQKDSFRTPTGLHYIGEKIGKNVPPFGILKDREFIGILAERDPAGADKDWITSRILWLIGMEYGHNKGGNVDSYERYIYIHGTANEGSIGRPSSRGCIRMLNKDVITLFDQIAEGALVLVLDN